MPETFMQQLLFIFRIYLSKTLIDRMRRKSDFLNTLTQMFCDDDKKRITAIKSIRDIASAIGPLRVRGELITFLNQFLDDQPAIMMAVLNQLTNFSAFLGGSEHDKILLPLLINFCSLDEKDVAMKAVEIILSILQKHPDAYLDTIKKIIKLNMSVGKECAAILITEAVEKVPSLEEIFLQSYKTLILSEVPAYRIIGSKHLKRLCEKSKNKDEILKMIELIYNDTEDLPKLYTIDTLIQLYQINANSVLSKFKTLICTNTWRVNMRLCEFADELNQVLSKSHYKVLFQSYFLKLMVSEDNQTRAIACSALPGIAKNMSPDEGFTKLYPTIVHLSEDKVDLVKRQFSKNITKVFPYFSKEKVQDHLIPIVIKLIKESNLEVASAILCEFKEMSKHISNGKYEEMILRPLAQQMTVNNWRVKIDLLEVLGKMILEQDIYTPFIVDLLINELRDKIEATRKKSAEILVLMVKCGNREWCETALIPKLIKIKDETSYLLRQKLISIISETCDSVSASTVGEYRKALLCLLVDKVPNIRVAALRTICCKKKLGDKMMEGMIGKLKDDSDPEVKSMAKTIKI